MDERNSHGQNDDNHCLHLEDNHRVTWQTQKPPSPQGAKCDKEGKSRHVICHSNRWSSRITRLLGPLQQQFFPIMSMTI